MITILFIIISIIFVGLGLPDSLFGSAWPAIYKELQLPVSYANFVTMLISSGTVLASFFSARIIQKFGTGITTALSTMLSTFAILGFSFSNSMIWFCLLALPLGIGAGAIDAALNNYVAVHYSAKYMSFLHSFYGLGVTLTPFLMSLALTQNNDWRLGYRIIFYVMAGITVISFIALPLWKKVSATPQAQEKEQPTKTLSFRQLIKMPAVRISWIVFFTSVALEFTCGIWGCTYLVESEGLTQALSAKIQTLYYLGITVGRFVSGLISVKMSQKNIVYSGYCCIAVALTLLFLPVPPIVKGIGLFLVGFGNGPTFPNLAYLTPIYFGKDISPSVLGTQMAVCNLGILLMPPVFGILADVISIKLFPVILTVLFLPMVIFTFVYHKTPKTKSKDLNLN